jgi:hypothetical protein
MSERGGLSLSSKPTRRRGFIPTQVSAVRAWYRMASSTPVSGEWETIVDMLGGASLTQTAALRKLAVSTSSNGLLTGTYDGTDVMRMPLHAGNFNASKYGLAYHIRLAGVGPQYLMSMLLGTAGVHVMSWIVASTGKLILTIYIGSNANGRIYSTADGAVSAGVYQFPRLQLDMTKTNEFDTTGSDADAKVRMLVNEVGLPLTASNEGAGGTLTTLRTPTGAALFGAANDSDSPGGALDNGTIHGPNTYVLLETPTAQQGQLLLNFDRAA